MEPTYNPLVLFSKLCLVVGGFVGGLVCFCESVGYIVLYWFCRGIFCLTSFLLVLALCSLLLKLTQVLILHLVYAGKSKEEDTVL
jgi:hypothetical protein